MDYLTVRVEDSGKGIAPEERDKIFLPFYTTKKNGTGLGLALVQKIIVSHNGRIRLEETAPAQGATFSILFPLRPPSPAA